MSNNTRQQGPATYQEEMDGGFRELTTREIDRRALFIHPGAWAVETERPLSTLLGSCVAVCLFDPVARMGGLNHFLLPEIRRSRNSPADSLLSGEVAMEALLNALLKKGVRKADIQAKAFGGGAVVDAVGEGMDVGRRNASFAKAWLRRENIPLLTYDLLGPWSRKLLFLPNTGDAFCRRMPPSLTMEDGGALDHAVLGSQRSTTSSPIADSETDYGAIPAASFVLPHCVMDLTGWKSAMA